MPVSSGSGSPRSVAVWDDMIVLIEMDVRSSEVITTHFGS
jgi:hypothetical protein